VKCGTQEFRWPTRIPSLTVLADLVAACTTSSHSRVVPVSRDWFNELLMQHAGERLFGDDHARFDLIHAAGQRGLLAARAGQAEAAREHFRQGQELLDTLPLSGEGHRLAESLLGAQQAYNHHQQHEDIRALQLRAFVPRRHPARGGTSLQHSPDSSDPAFAQPHAHSCAP